MLIEASPELRLSMREDAADSLRAQSTSYWARAVVGMVHSVAEKWSREYQQGHAPPRGVVVEQLTRWILAPLPSEAPRRRQTSTWPESTPPSHIPHHVKEHHRR